MCVTEFKCIKLFRGETALNLRKTKWSTNSLHSVGQVKKDVILKAGGMYIYHCSNKSYWITEK
jgi:hypothetical protein